MDPTQTQTEAPTKPTAPQSGIGPMKYGTLKQMNPRLSLNRVLDLKALYHGGSRLLGDDAVLSRLLPRYTHEKDAVYSERKRRAFYENILAQVINFISAGLAQDPVALVPPEDPNAPDPLALAKEKDPTKKPPFGKKPDEEDDEEDDEEEETDDEDEEPTKDKKPPFGKDKEKAKDDGEKKPPFPPKDKKAPPFGAEPAVPPKPIVVKKPPQFDQYWIDIMEDATPFSEDGSKRKSFDQVIRDACVEALICGWSWLQSDLPKPPSPELGPMVTSLLDQEKEGALRSYLVPWPTECVIDWEEREGRLLWIKTYQCEMVALDPTVPRDTRTHIYTIWTRDSWTRFVFQENQKLNQHLPKDEDVVAPTESGTHTFGRVPWTRLDLCATEGANLHIGDQIESICRSYFNRQNGEAYQWIQFYFQQLYEFLAPEMSGIDTPISDAQTDPGRAKRVRAPGEVQVRGHEDDARFVGPDMSGADQARKASQDLRDSIYRATAQMALSQDTSGAMLRRSGDSKRQDAVAQEIVLGAIGKKVLVLAKTAADLLAKGRGDKECPDLRGYERFDIFDADMLLNRASVVAQINIPSATYQVEHLYQLAVTDLGDSINEDKRTLIRQELEMTITQDSLMQRTALPPIEHDPDEEDPDLEEDDEKDEGDGKKPPFGKKGEDEEETPFDKDADKTKKTPPKNPFAKKRGGFE